MPEATTVTVPVRARRLLEYGMQLANMLSERDGLVAEKKRAAKEAQEEIDALDHRISVLGATMRTGYEQRNQGELFAEEAAAAGVTTAPALALDPTPEEAAAALAQVAEAAAETQTPSPSEPHAFDGTARGAEEGVSDQCQVCGADDADPVHHGGDQTVLRHVYSPAADAEEGAACAFDGCGRGPEDELHALGEAVAAAEKTAPPAVCPSCRQGTCEVHAHRFEGEGMRCTRAGCDKVARAKVHREPKDGWPAVEPVPDGNPADPQPVEPAEDAADEPPREAVEELAADLEAAGVVPGEPPYDFTGDEPPPRAEESEATDADIRESHDDETSGEAAQG